MDEPLYRWKGGIYSPSTWWHFADEMASLATSFTLYGPMAETEPPVDCEKIGSKHLQLCGRFFYSRIEQYYCRSLSIRTMLKEAEELLAKHDVVVLRVPSPVAGSLARMARHFKKPVVLLVAGDILSATSYRFRRSPKAVVARLVARFLRMKELDVARHSILVAVWSRDMLSVFQERNANTVIGSDPIIRSDQIRIRDDIRLGNPVRLVRVARLLPCKGLEHLIVAVAGLRRKGHAIMLDIVGGEDETSYLACLKEVARKHEVMDAIHFHGQLSFGPRLFDLYKRGDIHVISSISEGLPRCIFEARAFGVPTIATRVGGIPSVVCDGVDGLLINPADPEAIVQAVDRLLSDLSLRRRIIAEGYRRVQTQTVEFQARRLAILINRALSGEPLGPGQYNLHEI